MRRHFGTARDNHGSPSVTQHLDADAPLSTLNHEVNGKRSGSGYERQIVERRERSFGDLLSFIPNDHPLATPPEVETRLADDNLFQSESAFQELAFSLLDSLARTNRRTMSVFPLGRRRRFYFLFGLLDPAVKPCAAILHAIVDHQGDTLQRAAVIGGHPPLVVSQQKILQPFQKLHSKKDFNLCELIGRVAVAVVTLPSTHGFSQCVGQWRRSRRMALEVTGERGLH